MLTDVARHANASQVYLRLSNEDGGLRLELHDDGLEITEEKRSGAGRLESRECGSVLCCPSANKSEWWAGEGTTVKVRIPFMPVMQKGCVLLLTRTCRRLSFVAFEHEPRGASTDA
jgi:glucose-6-phosphate-specific signal transduction histidine kinase